MGKIYYKPHILKLKFRFYTRYNLKGIVNEVIKITVFKIQIFIEISQKQTNKLIDFSNKIIIK